MELSISIGYAVGPPLGGLLYAVSGMFTFNSIYLQLFVLSLYLYHKVDPLSQVLFFSPSL